MISMVWASEGSSRPFQGLETAGQGGVLFQVLAVLIERRGPDGLQFTAGQQRLQYRGGVDSPLRRARPYQGVQLVDEQDDVAAVAISFSTFFRRPSKSPR